MSIPISRLTSLSDLQLSVAVNLEIDFSISQNSRSTQDMKNVKIGNERGEKISLDPYLTLLKI